jgi:CelD/BcsL family acetyltransferase involved in cellulose biosynthesis/peptidoglycan/xylan/chitin deacetylase (PgdA/CDA1 family)
VPDRLLVLIWGSLEGGGRAAARSPAVATQLRYLRRFATVVPLGPAMEALGAGRALPPRAVALTFDDGYKDHLEIAAPLLQEFGLPATFFLAPALLSETGSREGAPFLDWNGARRLVRSGFSFGVRSTGHPIPQAEPVDQQLQDLATARRQLQEKLDVPVRLLAYPKGVAATRDLQLLHAIRHAGYSHAFTTRPGTVRRSTPAYAAPRVAVPRRWVPGVRTPPSARPAARELRPRPSMAGPRRDRLAPIRLETVPLEEVAEDLSRLALQTRNVFATGEWLSIWWRHFGTGHRALVTACRSADGRVIGVLPLYLWSSRPLRILRFIGHGAGDQLGPVYAAEDAAAVAEAMRRTLERLRWDIFMGDQLPASALWSSFLGAKVLLREGNPVLRARGDGWDGFLARRSSNFRQQLRRRQRRLAQEHRLAFRLVQDADELPDALDTLFRLHALRWPDGSAFQAKEAFHREVAAVGLARGWTRLWLLELDGEAVAAWYGLRFAETESYYQAGRDPAWDPRSVGFVLLAHSIRSAFNDGMQEYRFLRGQEAYKYRFAEEDAGLETIALTRGPAAGVALSAVRHAYPIVKGRLGQLRWKLV